MTNLLKSYISIFEKVTFNVDTCIQIHDRKNIVPFYDGCLGTNKETNKGIERRLEPFVDMYDRTSPLNKCYSK